MILDLERFLRRERPHWEELEILLARLEGDARLDLAEARRLHRLYERATADLARLNTYSAEPATRRYLEALVARAYAEIHETREPLRPARWAREFFRAFPQAFRRHLWAFGLSLALTLLGTLFGGLATALDPDSRHVTMPFGHDALRPAERVRREEAQGGQATAGGAAPFSAELMTHNTRVSILTLGLGMTGGVGTGVMLFYNGVVLGAVGWDYLDDGQGRFLAGWLLPHGSLEIPAILIAGQAGLLLGATLLGRRTNQPLRTRLRAVGPDLVTLIGGVAAMLAWAGLVEAFLSQLHEPALPYAVKIAFGLAELAALTACLARAGREVPAPARRPDSP